MMMDDNEEAARDTEESQSHQQQQKHDEIYPPFLADETSVTVTTAPNQDDISWSVMTNNSTQNNTTSPPSFPQSSSDSMIATGTFTLPKLSSPSFGAASSSPSSSPHKGNFPAASTTTRNPYSFFKKITRNISSWNSNNRDAMDASVSHNV
jgi:hypothetical protein